jgi:hypothetical protein
MAAGVDTNAVNLSGQTKTARSFCCGLFCFVELACPTLPHAQLLQQKRVIQGDLFQIVIPA